MLGVLFPVRICMCVRVFPASNMTSQTRRSFFVFSIVVLLILVFTVVAVAHIMDLGSAAFLIVVVAGAVVLLCFFCGLLAYARSRLSQADSNLPVFYYLQTIHRDNPATIHVDDDAYWLQKFEDSPRSANSKDSCPICLCAIDPMETATGTSNCCKKELHMGCAQNYFNAIGAVRCPLCRYPESPAPNNSQPILEIV